MSGLLAKNPSSFSLEYSFVHIPSPLEVRYDLQSKEGDEARIKTMMEANVLTDRGV